MMSFSIPLRTASMATAMPFPVNKGGDESGLPPGMRRVKTTCKACGKSLGIKYPDAVTYWKVQCPSCAQTISIELVGGRKCLVFDVRGRKTVERIGLTDQRRRFFRAKCFSCDENLVVPEQELGRLKTCHKCGLEFAVREDGEMYYETAVRINDEMTTYREKVQESTGYLVNKNMAFFHGEEPAQKGVVGKAGSSSEVTTAVTVMQREVEFLRKKEEVLRGEYRQAVADKEVLTRKLTKEMEKVANLERAARENEQATSQVAGLRTQVAKFTEERELLKNKLQVHGEALRALDEEMAKAARLEALVRRLEQEQAQLRETLGQSEKRLQRSLEERKTIEAKMVALKETASRLEERAVRGEKVNAAALQTRIQELELDNVRLTALAEEGRKGVKRLQELEKEVETLRRAGGVVESNTGEDWYCEEGEEACIRADNEVGMARRVLGIKGRPTAERITMAMRRRAKRYHPDMLSSLGLDLRDLAHRKMQDINMAYKILMKEYGNA
ncbi:MAG: hypothetical protein HQL93_09550 [Magnetococcales bacterium]|nr:hypothetical protein [Magnetococcales bacterium]